MKVGSDEFGVELPRAFVGGLRKRPTEDFLRRVAAESGQLYDDNIKLKRENARLKSTIEELEDRLHELVAAAEAAAAAAEAEPVPMMTVTETVEITAEFEPEDVDAAALVEDAEPALEQPASVAPEPEVSAEQGRPRVVLREPDELARAVLATAHRSARELQESTRRDCELMLRKARSRARALDREIARAKALKTAEIDELEALKRELLARMRSALEAIMLSAGGAGPTERARARVSNGSGAAAPAGVGSVGHGSGGERDGGEPAASWLNDNFRDKRSS